MQQLPTENNGAHVNCTVEDRSASGILDRVDSILEVVSVEGPVTLTDIARYTDLPRTTVHRLLDQMISHRWLTRIGNDYELGVRPFELGAIARQGHWFHGLARPHLEALRCRSRMLVHLAFLDGDSVLWWDRVGEVPRTVVPTAVGFRTPVHVTASGKALLSAEDDDFIDRVLPQTLLQSTRRTCLSRDDLSEQVCQVRDTGLAFDRGENVATVGALPHRSRFDTPRLATVTTLRCRYQCAGR